MIMNEFHKISQESEYPLVNINTQVKINIKPSSQETEHIVRVPRLPADFKQPRGFQHQHNHSEAVGQTKVPGYKPVSCQNLVAPPFLFWRSSECGLIF